ncbi:DUF305 domain-containing protein [Nocardioides sp.]|uniref:DUF305 domain-containing protein n=1 Tax=Nocardioides sp. TaxID=35761 RepID=UPI0026118361|nr:DUF305 domain-containing protein [Nocardioides sp.]
MHARTRFAALALALGSPLLLTACGGDDDTGTAADIPADAEFNQADVDFASQMIPHHAQALVMVDMADGRDVSPETADLMERIEAAQAPEIEQMTAWLEEWDQPVPDLGDMGGTGSDDMSGMDHGDMDDMDGMSGMMSAEDMADLEAAEGSAFEQMWLSMMIEHHEGAVEMAEVEVAEGEYDEAVALAEEIIEAQEAEIAEMEALLEG